MEPEVFERKGMINCRGKLLNLEKPLVMGILNLSPDSFYDGGKYKDIDKTNDRIDQMLIEGAAIIDIGAYSSRPGAVDISMKEELRRLKPVLEVILKKSDSIIVSIDTFRSEIAQIVIKDYGVSIINDISGGSIDQNMFGTIAKLNVPYILMHMKGTPQDMQANPNYGNVFEEIVRYFSVKLQSLKQLGVHDVILDPGFGFGKTLEHNYEILNKLDDFRIFELPVLAGLSRKSMIYKFLNCTPDEALNGTTVLNTIALQKGVNILRVHDVAEAKQTIDLFCKMSQNC
jgi:dihydropteroate synthase